ncbi:contractile injection system protein, VgrG/Pvc8 family [Vagococcus sp. WN89Y]|uniref:contractile injection system protein, VgrG/Pvc8 family n=1 Tax=Vagococcus sp. WN89Y TaxID=3457258 RepID=UPI003FCC383B
MIDTLVNQLAPPDSPLAPAYMLKIADKDITGTIASRLISMTVTDKRGLEADDLTLTLDDSDGLIKLPHRNATIHVYLGYAGQALTDLGEFNIDQISHQGAPDTVTVVGRSADFSGTLNVEQEVSWHDTTLGNIVRTIAARNKLKTHIDESLAQIKIAHIDQTLESDASFLHRLAVQNGGGLAIKRGILWFMRPGSGTGIDGQPLSVVIIARRDGDKHSFNIADRISYTGVVARWQDTKQPKKQTQQVQLQRKPAQQANGEPAKSNAPAYVEGNKENVYVISTIFPGLEEAKNAAEGVWKDIQARAATFSLTLAQGRTDITPETPIFVSGFKTEISQTPWVLTKVTHTINNSGFVSKLDMEIKIYEGQYDVQQS